MKRKLLFIICCVLFFASGVAIAGLFNLYPHITTLADNDEMVVYRVSDGKVYNITIANLRTALLSANVDISLTQNKMLIGGASNTAAETATVIGTGSPVLITVTNATGLGAAGAAGVQKYCTDCSQAATCSAGGSGHMAVSNGSAWTCR